MSVSQLPRLVRPVPSPLGLYFRAGRNDHSSLLQLLAQGHRAYHGIVIEATRVGRHQELISEAETSRIECILDPSTAASATLGGYSKAHSRLPWGLDRPHEVGDFSGAAGTTRLKCLAEFAVKNRFSQVMAPTHLVQGAHDPWVLVDRVNADALRKVLDEAGGKAIEMIYPLCVPYKTLRSEVERDALIQDLEGVPAASLWLRVDGLGSDSTAAALRNYMVAANEFDRLELPIVADQFGGLPGLSLLALGSVGGIATGLALGERFHAGNWKKPKEGRPFMPHARVYLSNIDFLVDSKEIASLFESNVRLRAHYGCKDPECCPRGVLDMVEKPARHFAMQKMRQVTEIGRHPTSVRLNVFIDSYVRPSTDLALQFARAPGLEVPLRARAAKHRQRIDSLRVTLGKLSISGRASNASRVPSTRSAREAYLRTSPTS